MAQERPLLAVALLIVVVQQIPAVAVVAVVDLVDQEE
jgi:hypothetical protein